MRKPTVRCRPVVAAQKALAWVWVDSMVPSILIMTVFRTDATQNRHLVLVPVPYLVGIAIIPLALEGMP